MKTSNFLFFCLLVTVICATYPAVSIAQSEKLGIVNYTPPARMSKTVKDNVVAFGSMDQTTGKFCIISLYGATPGTGNAGSDFAREWNNLVLKNMKAEANPKLDTQSAEGWTVNSGGSEVESDLGKAVGFLTVISGSGQTISILAVFNDPACANQVDSFIKGIDLDKPAAPAANTVAPPLTPDGNLIIPMPTRQLTIADLVGEWGESARISERYVYRDSGNYAGSDTLAFRSKMSITKNGGYLNDFFAIRNGQKIIDNTVGTVAINGRVLSIKHKGTAKYVIRGWLELPDMTVLEICGPWFDDDVIPQEIFSNPMQGANLNKKWVRKK